MQVEPTEGPFHDPPAGQHLECPAGHAPIPGSNRPPAWPTPPACRRRPHRPRSLAIGRSDPPGVPIPTEHRRDPECRRDALPPPAAAPEYPPQCDVCVPLPAGPRRNLAAPFFGGLHRLAVNDGSAGTGCPTLGLSQVGKEGVVGPLPGPILTPGAEVMEDNAPRWQVVGQHPPGATGAQHVANGVYDLAPRVLDRPTAGFGRRQQRFQQLPLFVVQIAGVNRSLHATTLRPTPNVTPLSTHPD